MAKFPYHFFEHYVVRTPLFSRKSFQEKAEKYSFSDKELKEICTDSVFLEAIFLGSPNLYNELKSWLHSDKNFSQNQYQKLKYAIIKYYTRMSTRCTPYGLFSGVGLGTFIKVTEYRKCLNYDRSQIRDTKFDMHLLVSISNIL